MAKSTAILAGVAAQADGQAFEHTLNLTHAAYRETGMASIDQMPVPTAPAAATLSRYRVRVPYKMLAILRILKRRQGYDYWGTFGPNAGPSYDLGRWFGLSIAAEAKSTTKRQSALRLLDEKQGGGGMKMHQLNALADSWRDFGVISVIIWRNGSERYVLLPPAVLLARDRFRDGGRHSVPVAEFESFDAVRYPRHPIVEDWLYTVRGWLESVGRPCPAMSTLKDYEMVNYKINEGDKTVTAFDGEGNEHLIEDVLMDFPMINSLAVKAENVDQFKTWLKDLAPANEPRETPGPPTSPANE